MSPARTSYRSTWAGTTTSGRASSLALPCKMATRLRDVSKSATASAAFNYVARYNNGSTELATLLALTTGTAVVGLANGTNDTFTGTWQQMGFKVVELGDVDGIVTVSVTGEPQYNATNGLAAPSSRAQRARSANRLLWKISNPFLTATKTPGHLILSGGEKRCEVRFPSDAEWCAWARAQRTIRHFLGRGKSQSEDVDLSKVNAELFTKIRTDHEGPEFDEAEAGMVIGRIERCNVTGIDREGNNYRIAMKVPGRSCRARASDADSQRDAGP